MDLIDDQGRLFGLVNVVDALVLLLVATVVVAGVAFVLQPDEQPEPETITREVTLQMTNVQPYLSNAIQAGMTETADGRTVATITDVERTPSKLVVTDQNGSVFVRDHPIREDVTLTAELETRETATGVTFKGRTIQVGSTIVLDLGDVTIEATVTEL